MDLPRFYPLSLLDQSFGLCFSPQDLIFPSYNYPGTNYYRPWKWYLQSEKDFGSTIQSKNNKFEIILDVQHFQPSEINVKVADRDVIIEGKHEERQDHHGFISRQFKRRYLLPTDCNADSVVSSLSSDGVLTVTADKTKEMKTKEIIVPIKRCDTCPNKDLLKTKIEKTEKEKVKQDTKKMDNESSKKKMEIMLKEDHCCLMKPELLGAPSTAATQKITDDITKVDDLLKKTPETSVQAPSIAANQKKTSEAKKVDELLKTTAETFIQAPSTGTTQKKTSEPKNVDELLKETAETSVQAQSAAATQKIATGSKKVDEFLKTTAETAVQGPSTAATQKITIETEKELDDLLKTTAKTSVQATSTKAKLKKMDAACRQTTVSKSEIETASTAAKSEMCNIKSTLTEAITIQESLTSSNSMASSSIKETGEKISEIVSDISAQLKEAAENI